MRAKTLTIETLHGPAEVRIQAVSVMRLRAIMEEFPSMFAGLDGGSSPEANALRQMRLIVYAGVRKVLLNGKPYRLVLEGGDILEGTLEPEDLEPPGLGPEAVEGSNLVKLVQEILTLSDQGLLFRPSSAETGDSGVATHHGSDAGPDGAEVRSGPVGHSA